MVKKQAVINATIFNLKRDRAFWKRRAEANIKNIIQQVEKIIDDPDRKTISMTKLKKLIISKRSGLDKFITIQVRLSDLFETIGEIKNETSMWRKTYDLSSRMDKLEKQLNQNQER